MSNDPNRQGQQLPPPPPWTSGPEYPPPYPPHSSQPYQYPPSSAAMAAIQQHPQQDAYRLAHPAQPFQPRPDMYHQQPSQAAPVVYQAAAPRQRTAIACRYCRRRKIRCSGFDTSQDGRCSNCVRFNQECMFTPVSSQTQAFVPAHAAYPHLRSTQSLPRGPREGVVLYGPQGQPLPPHPAHAPESALPPPPMMYQQQPYQRPDERTTLPPPLAHPPQPMHQDHRPPHVRRGSGGYDYSESPTLPPVSMPGSSSAYPPPQSIPTSGPYYPPTNPQNRRHSSHSTYSHDQSHCSTPTSNPPYPTLQPPHHPPSAPPSASNSGTTPPPGQSPAPSRVGLSVRDMLAPVDGSSARTPTDSDMLSALDRRGKK